MSEYFHVTTDYLLKGSEATAQTLCMTCERETKKHSGWIKKNIRYRMLVILSVASLVTIITCVICDYFIAGSLTWSLMTTLSVVFGWTLLLPLLSAKENAFRKSLVFLSALTIPYLAAVSSLLREPLIVTLGTCVAVVSIVGLWCIYGVWSKFCDKKLRA